MDKYILDKNIRAIFFLNFIALTQKKFDIIYFIKYFIFFQLENSIYK